MSGVAGSSRLSFGQERLWFLAQLDPEDASYNIPLVLRLTGPLAVPALRAALRDVVERHAPLRTRFPAADGHPAAVADAPPELEEIDLEGRPEGLGALLAERSNAPFDLAAGPLLRATLVRLGAREHVLSLVVHHIVADGWSLNVLRAELAACYAAARDGRAPDLPALPTTYDAFAQAQRAADGEASLAYWREQLAGVVPLELPTDHPRPPVASSAGAYHTRTLGAGIAAELDRFAREQRCSPFMVLLAAYQALLGRHTGQDDLCVGSPIAGRTEEELEGLIGYFSSTLILRADLSGAPTFRELLRRTRRTALGAYGHQEVPIERLLDALRLERDLGRNPLFQTLLTVHTQDGDAHGRERAFADLSVVEADGGHTQSKVDLSLDVWRSGDDFTAVFGYQVALFEPETVAALAARFERLLRAALADPDRRVADLPLLEDRELDLLRAWGDGGAGPGERPATVLEQIGAQAAARPDAVALESDAETLTYAELWAAAGRLAGELVAAGPPAVVGVCLPRGPRAVVAALAAWRAGAAYLPVDPAYPQSRRAFMLADAGAAVVVTEDGVRAAGGPPGPMDAAYVIYTSGSTGTPKGVLVPHSALAARVAWMRHGYGIGPDDRVLQFASLSFDTHAEELYPCLSAGGTVRFAPPGGELPPADAGVTVLDLPTPFWHRLVDDLDNVAWPPTLRTVILGADQVDAAAVRAWKARFGDRVRLVNSYGPTETTIIATVADLAGEDGRPPIGRPLWHTRVAVCDRDGALVPPGVPGELCVGGDGVAYGYLGHPGRTALAFEPDPDGPPGARRYRTGDRVRWRRDGQLEFLGRLDDQVKVRGFRIEPGEVRAALLALDGVGQAAVVARQDALVAYLVPAAGTPAPDPAALRAALAETLPAHMVPTAFVALAQLPLTVNGKLDRAALPDPVPQAAAEYVAPRTDAEDLVAGVWAEVLGVDKVGALDDFFDLGGHSLLATRMIARVRAAIDLAVPIRTLFTHRTVAAFATAVEELLIAEIEAMPEETAEQLLATGRST
ncbi:condensation domain-containing protein [Dactylosporangium sp. NPDC051485]|uniref:condensation domain-containing protein n=1 Tax=Dactylosporangium sp. NPDC051485 TaxID=3154846 RepID=UPI0034282D90